MAQRFTASKIIRTIEDRIVHLQGQCDYCTSKEDFESLDFYTGIIHELEALLSTIKKGDEK